MAEKLPRLSTATPTMSDLHTAVVSPNRGLYEEFTQLMNSNQSLNANKAQLERLLMNSLTSDGSLVNVDAVIALRQQLGFEVPSSQTASDSRQSRISHSSNGDGSRISAAEVTATRSLHQPLSTDRELTSSVLNSCNYDSTTDPLQMSGDLGLLLERLTDYSSSYMANEAREQQAVAAEKPPPASAAASSGTSSSRRGSSKSKAQSEKTKATLVAQAFDGSKALDAKKQQTDAKQQMSIKLKSSEERAAAAAAGPSVATGSGQEGLSSDEAELLRLEHDRAARFQETQDKFKAAEGRSGAGKSNEDGVDANSLISGLLASLDMAGMDDNSKMQAMAHELVKLLQEKSGPSGGRGNAPNSALSPVSYPIQSMQFPPGREPIGFYQGQPFYEAPGGQPVFMPNDFSVPPPPGLSGFGFVPPAKLGAPPPANRPVVDPDYDAKVNEFLNKIKTTKSPVVAATCSSSRLPTSEKEKSAKERSSPKKERKPTSSSKRESSKKRRRSHESRHRSSPQKKARRSKSPAVVSESSSESESDEEAVAESGGSTGKSSAIEATSSQSDAGEDESGSEASSKSSKKHRRHHRSGDAKSKKREREKTASKKHSPVKKSSVSSKAAALIAAAKKRSSGLSSSASKKHKLAAASSSKSSSSRRRKEEAAKSKRRSSSRSRREKAAAAEAEALAKAAAAAEVRKKEDAEYNLLKQQVEEVEKQMTAIQQRKTALQARKKLLDDQLVLLRKQEGELCKKEKRHRSEHNKKLLDENEKLQRAIEKELKATNEPIKQIDDVIHEAMPKLDDYKAQMQLHEIKRRAQIEEVQSAKDVLAAKMGALLKPASSGSPAKKSDRDSKPSAKSKDASAAVSSAKSDAVNYEYFDAGSHWCRQCNVTVENITAWLQHLHSPEHRKAVGDTKPPWPRVKVEKSSRADDKSAKSFACPLKGVEFLCPATAYFCVLCGGFSGDAVAAEQHVKSHAHNLKYQEHLTKNPSYEKNYNLEKVAAFAVNSAPLKKSQPSLSSSSKDSAPSSSKDKRVAAVAKSEAATSRTTSAVTSSRNVTATATSTISSSKPNSIVSVPSTLSAAEAEANSVATALKFHMELKNRKNLAIQNNPLLAAAASKLQIGISAPITVSASSSASSSRIVIVKKSPEVKILSVVDKKKDDSHRKDSHSSSHRRSRSASSSHHRHRRSSHSSSSSRSPSRSSKHHSDKDDKDRHRGVSDSFKKYHRMRSEIGSKEHRYGDSGHSSHRHSSSRHRSRSRDRDRRHRRSSGESSSRRRRHSSRSRSRTPVKKTSSVVVVKTEIETPTVTTLPKPMPSMASAMPEYAAPSKTTSSTKTSVGNVLIKQEDGLPISLIPLPQLKTAADIFAEEDATFDGRAANLAKQAPALQDLRDLRPQYSLSPAGSNRSSRSNSCENRLVIDQSSKASSQSAEQPPGMTQLSEHQIELRASTSSTTSSFTAASGKIAVDNIKQILLPLAAQIGPPRSWKASYASSSPGQQSSSNDFGNAKGSVELNGHGASQENGNGSSHSHGDTVTTAAEDEADLDKMALEICSDVEKFLEIAAASAEAAKADLENAQDRSSQNSPGSPTL